MTRRAALALAVTFALALPAAAPPARAQTAGAQPSGDRHEGYYYPKVTSRETVS